MTTQAKVFWTGRSQAVRIPAEFRLDCRTVTVTRTENGGLLIEPDLGWPKNWLQRFAGKLDDLRRPPQGRHKKRGPLL